MGQHRRPHTSVVKESEQHTSSAYGQPLRQRCCPTTLNCPGGRSLSITTSRQIASGKHFKGQMARPRSSHVPMHCRYSKAPTLARFARRLNGEEDACGHEDRLPSVRWQRVRLRCRLPHDMVPRAASRASAEARLVLPPNITSPTCGRQSRRRTTVLRLYGMCKPQPGHDAILAVLSCKTQRDARPGCVAGVLYGKKNRAGTSRR